MKRYGLAPILGTAEQTGINDSYRPAFADVSQTNFSCLMPTHPAGHPEQFQPKFNFTFCIVATANIAGVLAVSNSFVFPDYSLDGRLDGMEPETRAAMIQNLQAYDLDGAGFHLDAASHNLDANSYRQFLQAIGAQFEPVFNINTFDAQEPSA